MTLKRRQRILDQALLATRNLGEKLHEKATEVRPSLLDDVGLRSSVVDLLHRFESRYGLVCDAELEFQTELVPVHVRENVFTDSAGVADECGPPRTGSGSTSPFAGRCRTVYDYK